VMSVYGGFGTCELCGAFGSRGLCRVGRPDVKVMAVGGVSCVSGMLSVWRVGRADVWGEGALRCEGFGECKVCRG